MNEHLLNALQRIYTQGATQNDNAHLVHLLSEEGFTTQERFAELLVELVEEERKRRSVADPIGSADLRWIDQQRSCNLRIRHRPPAGPFQYRGEFLEPADIRRFDDTALHFVVLADGHSAKLIAYERYEEVARLQDRRAILSMIKHEIGERLAPSEQQPVTGSIHSTSVGIHFNPPSPTPPQGEAGVPDPPGAGRGGAGYVTCHRTPERPNGEARFFEHNDFTEDGHWFWLAPGKQIPRLTEWQLSHAFLSGSATWNDSISSIRSGDGVLVLFEHIEYQGSTLTMFGSTPKLRSSGSHPMCGPYHYWAIEPPRQEIAALGDLGWNDRISSMQHFPAE